MHREIRLKVDDTVGPRKLWNRKTTLKQLLSGFNVVTKEIFLLK